MDKRFKFYYKSKVFKTLNEFLKENGDTVENRVIGMGNQVSQNPDFLKEIERNPSKYKNTVYECLKDFINKKNYLNIVSWNVNGLRSRIVDNDLAAKCKRDSTKVIEKKSNLGRLIERIEPEIICFQETKSGKEFEDCFSPIEYPYRYWNCSQGIKGRQGNRYSGVSVWSKIKPKKILKTIPTLPKEDKEGRVLILEFDKFILINTYSPNSGTNETYRLNTWDKAMKKYLENLKKENKKVIWCGDLNVALRDMDVHFSNVNSSTYQKRIMEGKHLVAGFLPEERENLREILKLGYIDVYENLYPTVEKSFTWWDPKIPIFRVKNHGWRLDYFIVSKNLKGRIVSTNIWKDIGTYTKPQGSDHAPISLTIRL